MGGGSGVEVTIAIEDVGPGRVLSDGIVRSSVELCLTRLEGITTGGAAV